MEKINISKYILINENYEDENKIFSLITLPNKKFASSSQDKTIKIFSQETFECILTLSGHEKLVNSISNISKNRIISGSRDQTIKIWSFNIEKKYFNCDKTFFGHLGEIHKVIEIEKKEGNFISTSQDKTLRIWNEISNQCTLIINIINDNIWDVINISNNRICFGSEFKEKEFYFFNINNCEIVYKLEFCVPGNNALKKINDKLIAIGTYEKIIILNVYNYEIEKILFDEGIDYYWCVYLLSDNSLICSNSNKKLSQWDLERGEKISELNVPNDVSSIIEINQKIIVTCAWNEIIIFWGIGTEIF